MEAKIDQTPERYHPKINIVFLMIFGRALAQDLRSARRNVQPRGRTPGGGKELENFQKLAGFGKIGEQGPELSKLTISPARRAPSGAADRFAHSAGPGISVWHLGGMGSVRSGVSHRIVLLGWIGLFGWIGLLG